MKIHYFNPGHETAVLNASPYYMAPANVVSMQQELAFLPAWYGNTDDVVLVDNVEDKDYYSHLSKHFPQLPKAISVAEPGKYTDGEIVLWGISPQAIHFLEERKAQYDTNIHIPSWEDEYTYLNSRMAARDCLEIIINRIPDISEALLPRFFSNLDNIENIVNISEVQLLAKAPYSSSGRGLLWLPKEGLTRTERQILHGILKKQEYVSVEQVLNKETDFAMEFMSDGRGNIRFIGYSLFYTNKKGGYEANYIGSQEYIEKQLAGKISLDLLKEVAKEFTVVLGEKYAHAYKGCIGVDMLIYKDNNEYKLHPCLEVNMRYNMGYLAYKLYENYIHPDAEGRFHLDFSAKGGCIYNRHLQMQEQFPASFKGNRLVKGYFPLCPVKENSKYWAYVLIDNS